MEDWRDDIEELDDLAEQYHQDNPGDEILSMEIPDVWWADDIAQIENLEIRAKEIEFARKIVEKEEALERQLESGEITKDEYLDEYEFEILPQKRKAATRCALESVGLSYDHLGDLAEDYDLLIRDLNSPEEDSLLDKKEKIKEIIDRIGPQEAQELADRMLDKGKISEQAYEMICRQVRLYGKG